MGKGKVAAQCSHATLGLYKKVEDVFTSEGGDQCKKQGGDVYLQTSAKMMKLPCHTAVDVGRTQIAPSTYFVPAVANAVAVAVADAADSRPRLLEPVRHLLSDAVQRSYAKYNSQGLAHATSNSKFVAAPNAAIMGHYSAIIRSIVNYYSFVHGRSAL